MQQQDIPNTEQQQPVKKSMVKEVFKSMRNWTVLVVTLIFIGFFVLSQIFIRNEIKDSKYKFDLRDIGQWKEIPPQDKAYRSFAIVEDEKLLTYADIRPLSKSTNKKFDRNYAMKSCDKSVRDLKAMINAFNDILVNNIPGYKCEMEVASGNKEKKVVTQYVLMGNDTSEYIYYIYISYLKDSAGKKHAQSFIENFFIY